MMTFSPYDLSKFFGATERANMTAEDALRDLEARGITGALTVRLGTPRAVCDSVAQKAGRKLSECTAHEIAALLAQGWGSK